MTYRGIKLFGIITRNRSPIVSSGIRKKWSEITVYESNKEIAVEAAYRRGDLLEKRRMLANDWEHWCENGLPKGTNVIPIKKTG